MNDDPLSYLESQLTLRERARMAHQDRIMERQSNLAAKKVERVQQASELLRELLGVDVPSWDHGDEEVYKWDVPTNRDLDGLKLHFRHHGFSFRVLMVGTKDDRHPALQVNQNSQVLVSPSGWSPVTSLADLGDLLTKHPGLAREPEDG